MRACWSQAAMSRRSMPPGAGLWVSIGEGRPSENRTRRGGNTDETRAVHAGTLTGMNCVPSKRPRLSRAGDSEWDSRVEASLSSLELEISAQRAMLLHLRECSLQTEHTMQELLKSIERLICSNNPQ